MSNSITKKLTSVLLSATTVVWLTGSSLLAPVAFAQSTDLQAQINALLAQIAALQAQLASGSSSSAPSYNYTRNLTVGSRGADVTALQNFLISKGHLKIASATEYFGSLTKAALAAYQASVGISPAVGYFGPITRAKVASVGAAPSPTPSPAPGPVVGGSGLSVSLASDQPASGLFGESFASRPFTKLVLTASSDGDITVASLSVERTGQGNDAAFSGVVGLDENGIRMGDTKTFGSDHKLKLTDKFVVKAGQSRTITLSGDSDADQNDYNGQLVSLSLVGVDAGSANVNAGFPLVGNYMTVNSTLTIGSMTLERGALDPGTAATKEIGTAGYIFAGLKLTAGANEDILVKSIRWNQGGSAAASDLGNLKTYLDGVMYDTTVSTDGKYYTAIFGTGITIAKGLNKEVYIKGDVLSGSNRGVDFDLYRYADIKATGMTYGYDVLPTATDSADSSTDDDGTLQNTQPNYDAYEVTIGAGSLSVEKATSVGSQNIAENLADQVLGGFVADVKGEDVTVAAMNFDASTIEAAGTGGTIDSNDLTNVTLVDENGKVVAGPVDGQVGGNNAFRFSDTVTFKVGRHTYTLKGKIGTDFAQNDQFAASTTPSSDWTTVKGTNSSQTITPSGGTVTLSTMTIKTGALVLTISTDTASSSPNQNVVKGTGAYQFAKYILDASESGEDLRITSMQLDLTTSYPANTADELTNCQLKDGATALNTGTNIVNPSNDDAAGVDKTFTFDTSLVVPKGTAKTLALVCNLTAGGTVEYVGWGAGGLTTAANQAVVTGVTSGTSVAETVTTDLGRTIVAQTGGTLTLALDSSSPSLKLIQAGATDQTLSVLRFNASYEDVRLDLLGLQLATTSAANDQANASNSPSDLTKVTLWDGATKVGEVTFTGDYATATLSNFVIPKDGQKLLTIKADISPMNTTLSQAVPGHLINVDYNAAWGDAPDDDANEGAQGGKAIGISSGTTVYTAGVDTASNGARIVKAMPTLSKLATSGKFTNTSDQTLYRFKIDAPAGTNGVSLYKMTFNVSTSTTAVTNYETEDAGVFRVTNLRLYCYSDAGFSQGSCGNSSGLLNQFGLAIADGTNVDFEDVVSNADPDVDVAVLFNPTASSGATAEAIRISAGETRWFELKADVTGASSTPNISTKILGDAGWNAVHCDVAASENVVSACDYSPSPNVGQAQAGRFTATAALIDAVSAGTFTATTEATIVAGDDDNFIWSDNATNSTQGIASDDWFTGFLLPGVPSVSTSAEVLTF
ncbi:MAG: SpoIID/LytB protein [Parcubacteria group bacterium Gr01-1014_3]|nr:MAG: SpoIID/LytB protein [Parcubacteria group bacterium Gr01-1014_3]